MEENVKLREETQPQAETGEEQAETIRIPIKFNKEVRELTPQEAADYAQKGMKFELIQPDFERLRKLAQSRKQSLPQLVESLCKDDRDRRLAEWTSRCGDEALARRVMELEEAAAPDDSFAELRQNFPEFNTLQDLPEAVRIASAEKGTRLLDEYLRYRLEQSRQRRLAERDRKDADASAVGSQKKYAVGTDPVHTEFLRGIWGR